MTISDTTQEALNRQLELLGNMTPGDRVALALRLSCDVMNAARNAIVRLNPDLTEQQQCWLYIEALYGKELAEQVRDHVQQTQDPDE